MPVPLRWVRHAWRCCNRRGGGEDDLEVGVLYIPGKGKCWLNGKVVRCEAESEGSRAVLDSGPVSRWSERPRKYEPASNDSRRRT